MSIYIFCSVYLIVNYNYLKDLYYTLCDLIFKYDTLTKIILIIDHYKNNAYNGHNFSFLIVPLLQIISLLQTLWILICKIKI